MKFECSEELVDAVLACANSREIGRLIEAWLDSDTGVDRRFPAADDAGGLQVPHAHHVIDALLHRFELYDEGSIRDLTGGLGVVAFMYDDRTCDICREERARYDALMAPSHQWAFMCGSCYRLNSHRLLGMGAGQYLVYPNVDEGGCVDLYKHINTVIAGGYP